MLVQQLAEGSWQSNSVGASVKKMIVLQGEKDLITTGRGRDAFAKINFEFLTEVIGQLFLGRVCIFLLIRFTNLKTTPQPTQLAEFLVLP